MKPTMEILTKLRENSKKQKEEIFTKLFRYLLRSDIYFVAYQHLYSNKGADTKGINDDTADGFSEESISKIIESLRKETYQPKPVRRIYIKKSNGKLLLWLQKEDNTLKMEESAANTVKLNYKSFLK